MAGMSAMTSSLLSDLRGVTVRNTFLEYANFGGDDDDMFDELDASCLRQTSEPAKPFNRQVSEQTTAGSGHSVAEASSFDTDDPSSAQSLLRRQQQLAAYVAATQHMVQEVGSPKKVAACPSPSLPVAHAGAFMEARSAPMAHAAGGAGFGGGYHTQGAGGPSVGGGCRASPPIPRFCPSCGSEAEPAHRFCPYCCFQLQALQPSVSEGPARGSANGKHTTGGQPSWAAGETSAFGAEVLSGHAGARAPNLLSCLRRFRYVEASFADVELARMWRSTTPTWSSHEHASRFPHMA
mmetsp:Transcript_17346/g.60609  ORF Transcript_17346/g.60609 Transcript_17346/m.60609 type:complete len:294 (-) Transcript_17346:320-1201(-)